MLDKINVYLTHIPVVLYNAASPFSDQKVYEHHPIDISKNDGRTIRKKLWRKQEFGKVKQDLGNRIGTVSPYVIDIFISVS